MEEGVKIVSLRRSESCGLGFSILGGAGSELPPIIYDIIENSPASESGQLEAGDVILEVNRRNVYSCTTKEVLKCLRLSGDEVTLKLKRDPQIKAEVLKYLASSDQSFDELHRLLNESKNKTNGSYTKLIDDDEFNIVNKNECSSATSAPTPRFEAYMMTGDLILNLSRTQQTTGIIPPQKAIDSLRYHNSVPTSPNESDLGIKNEGIKMMESSKESSSSVTATNVINVTCVPTASTFGFVRTSRSEDHLQLQKDSISTVDIDIDEDVTSSLNTLLDTRQEMAAAASGESHDRIVWTYNAPSDSINRGCSSDDSDSPTSVSSSVMSSESSKKIMLLADESLHNGDYSQSEAISSPDFQEEDSMDILSSKDLIMQVSDPSDSDSTILVSERTSKAKKRGKNINSPPDISFSDYQELKESEDDDSERPYKSLSPPPTTAAAAAAVATEDDISDIESLHSFHYSPKAVDIPSAVRLAKRLHSLDGFKKSDVSRHLSKNNDFSRAVAEEYLRFFSFENDSLDIALRKFLKQFSLSGETQERERVLVHFSKRYLDCNPAAFKSQDAIHTLTCAIMMLNTDLHADNFRSKMTVHEFIDNLSGLNDGENFSRGVLKTLYLAIKYNPLVWAVDDDNDEAVNPNAQNRSMENPSAIGNNPFLDVPNSAAGIEYKKGYVMRKSCIEPNGKKTPFGKRGWKMFYCTLRDMVLYLHKDEHGFRKSQIYDNLHNAIRIHHALATKATDYNKKQHVFRLQTADQSEYLFQTSDSKELQSWIDTINFVAASFSAQPLACGVGSQRRFQRPLLPCTHTKLNLREQLRDHEERVARLEAELEEHRGHPPDKQAKSLNIQNYKEKDAFLYFELKRYKTYAYLLRSKISQYPEVETSLVESCIGELDEASGETIVPPPIPDRPRASLTPNRDEIKKEDVEEI